MTSDATIEALNDLGIRGLAAELDAFVARAGKERWSTTELIEHFIDIERTDRARRSLERRTARSRVGAFKPLADFDWSWFRSVDRDALDRVMKLDFVRDGANVVVVGPHGIGKTTILKNVCHQAIVAGHTVLFTTASKLIGDVTATDSPSTLHRRLKYYVRASVLAIDELGYLSYDQRAADLLFEIVSRRHEVGKPVLISTNLAFREWGTVFPNATCTVALVDRLTHRADVIKLDAESWRRKEAQERAERQASESA
jgi:DNA replication protein DnaC